MYGRLGAPALGAAGSGLATALTLWLELAAFGLWLRFSGRYRGLGRGRRAPDLAALGGLLAAGRADGLQRIAGGESVQRQRPRHRRIRHHRSGSHQVAITATGLSFMVPLGLSTAITVRVAHAAGAGDRAGVRRAGLVGMGLALGFESLTCALFLLAPAVIAGVFTDEAAVAAGAVPLLRLAGCSSSRTGCRSRQRGRCGG
ncbi:MAG: MATE family efflux transporter [Acetobacteraceae bacterium]